MQPKIIILFNFIFITSIFYIQSSYQVPIDGNEIMRKCMGVADAEHAKLPPGLGRALQYSEIYNSCLNGHGCYRVPGGVECGDDIKKNNENNIGTCYEDIQQPKQTNTPFLPILGVNFNYINDPAIHEKAESAKRDYLDHLSKNRFDAGVSYTLHLLKEEVLKTMWYVPYNPNEGGGYWTYKMPSKEWNFITDSAIDFLLDLEDKKIEYGSPVKDIIADLATKDLATKIEIKCFLNNLKGVVDLVSTLKGIHDDIQNKKISSVNTPEAKNKRDGIATELAAKTLYDKFGSKNPYKHISDLIDNYDTWRKLHNDYSHYLQLNIKLANPGYFDIPRMENNPSQKP